MIRTFEFRDVLSSLTGDSSTASCPFRTSSPNCVPPNEWFEHDKAPKSFLALETTCSYVGVDLTSWWFDESGYMRSAYASMILCFIATTFLYVGIFWLAEQIFALPNDYNKTKESSKQRTRASFAARRKAKDERIEEVEPKDAITKRSNESNLEIGGVFCDHQTELTSPGRDDIITSL